MLTFGWKPKAVRLRTMVLSCPELAKELPPQEHRLNDLMRQIGKMNRRGADDAEIEPFVPELDALMESMENGPGLHRITFEPANINGWKIRAGMYLRDGKHYWLVGAEKTTRSISDKDRKMLAQIIDLLGGHIDHDQLSMLTLDDLVEESTACFYTWINQHQLLEIQVRNRGKKTSSKDVRVVPQGTPASDGFEYLPLPPDESA